MDGRWVQQGDAAGTAVVFVHGVLSSPETCWKHANGTDWPKLCTEDPEFEDIGIYVFQYRTGFFSGGYQLSDAVDDLKERLRLDKVSTRKRIVFVCHSMGGILVRKYLVSRAADLIDSRTRVGLFLIASPSLGADYANWLAPLARVMGHAQADVLRFSNDNQWLMDLDQDFMDLKESGRLRLTGKELVEDQFVCLRKLWRKQVVPTISGARYFGEAYKVPASDHSSIAKVENDRAIQYRLLREFVVAGSDSAPPRPGREHEPQSSASDPADYGLGAALRLDRSPEWAGVLEASLVPGNFLFLYHGSYDQDVQLFVQRIKWFFSSRADRPRKLVRVPFALDGVTPQTGSDWTGHMRDGLGCQGAPLAECLAAEVRTQPLFIILGHSPLAAGRLTERQSEALREFLTDELPATLAKANLQSGIALLLPFDYLTGVPPPLIDQVQQWGQEAQKTGWLKFRPLARASLPTWKDVDEYLTGLDPKPGAEQIELIRGEYEERAGKPGLSFNELARIVDSYTQYG